SSRRRHTRSYGDWSSDVCSADLATSSSIGSLALGAHTVTASYEADTNFATSTTTLSQPVDQAPTSTVVSGSPANSVFGQPVTFRSEERRVGQEGQARGGPQR